MLARRPESSRQDSNAHPGRVRIQPPGWRRPWASGHPHARW